MFQLSLGFPNFVSFFGGLQAVFFLDTSDILENWKTQRKLIKYWNILDNVGKPKDFPGKSEDWKDATAREVHMCNGQHEEARAGR